MARLTTAKAEELIRIPKNKVAIEAARRHEERLVFHCEPVMDTSKLPASAKDAFFAWVESFLPTDKMKRFKQLLTVPVDTVESTKAIFDELGKFLEAQDRYISFEFTADSIRADFNDYTESINDQNFWRTKGLEALRTNINNFIVVDCQAQQLTLRPEPYYYFVNIHSVIDADISHDDNAVEYIVFKRVEDGKVVVIDDEFYRLFRKDDGKDTWTLEMETRHSVFTDAGELVEGLGYCPATQFFNKPIYNSRMLDNRGPLTDVLGKLDWLLFWRTSKKYLDCYGAWPIIVTYKEECKYRDRWGNTCFEGYVDTKQWSGDDWKDCQIKCPACSAKEVIGPGSFWEVDPPADSKDVDMLRNPVHIVEIGNDKLEYGVSEILRLEDEIYLDCVGYDGDALNKQAINKTQVSANFESKKAVLDGLKSQFERAHKFAIETLCRLRYGRYFLRSVVDYGSDYFLRSAADLAKEYTDAKAAGLPGYYLATLREQVSRTRFRNNPQQMERDDILAQLEPYPDFTAADLQSLQIATVDPIGFIIKINFINFIQRFEREQTNVLEFGSLIPFGQKISIIQQKLTDYANERQVAPSTRPNTGGNGQPQAGANGGGN